VRRKGTTKAVWPIEAIGRLRVRVDPWMMYGTGNTLFAYYEAPRGSGEVRGGHGVA